MADEIRIVLVDDESAILDLLQAALEDGGYAVAATRSGEEALTLLTDASAHRQALVTDIDIGQNALSGWDLAQKAREVDPQVPVVYMTGASGGDWPSRGVPNSILVLKPFAPAQVVTAVSQLLNDQGAAPG